MLATAIFSGALAGLLWLLLTPFRTGLRSIPGPWFRQFTGRYLIHTHIRGQLSNATQSFSRSTMPTRDELVRLLKAYTENMARLCK